jgi:hypothetical protein
MQVATVSTVSGVRLCERMDCQQEATYVLRWTQLGAPEDAYSCREHARKSRAPAEPLEAK